MDVEEGVGQEVGVVVGEDVVDCGVVGRGRVGVFDESEEGAEGLGGGLCCGGVGGWEGRDLCCGGVFGEVFGQSGGEEGGCFCARGEWSGGAGHLWGGAFVGRDGGSDDGC